MMNPTQCPWGHLEPAAISFCEQRLCQWVVEPANTWSNIGFLIAGVLILSQNRRAGRSDLSMIGWISIVLGVGSAAFHATGTRIGEVIDVSSMYLISGLFLTFHFKRYFGLTFSKLVMIFLALAATSIVLLIVSGSNGIQVFALQIAVSVLLEYLLSRRRQVVPINYKYAKYIVLGFVVAFGSWFLDVKHIVCDPNNHILGGHAVWHLANATCLWSYYKFQEQFS